MNVKCLFGHKWNDSCKCERCGETRDERHDWSIVEGKCIEKCFICGQERRIDHKWNGCKCVRCGTTRNEGHKWVLLDDKCIEKCSLCGQERIGHKWNGCKCERCSATRDEGHKWNWNLSKCGVCGATRDEKEHTSKKIRFIACICYDQPNINSLKPILQKYIVDKELSEGNIITQHSIISFDSTTMSSLLNDRSYMNQMLSKMLSKAYSSENIYDLLEKVINKGDYNAECKAKFFILYE